jgi:NAD-dependent SIR2 family protein deacetylase
MTTFPAMFKKKGFFSFHGKSTFDLTSRELKNFILFKNWCKHNNCCFDCSLASQYAPVKMDEDMIPNCPNCDSYYYEEFKEAQLRADKVAKGEKVCCVEALWEDFMAADLCGTLDDFLLI